MKAFAVDRSYAVIHSILFILSKLKRKTSPAPSERNAGMEWSSPSAPL